MKRLILYLAAATCTSAIARADLPTSYDLRDYGYVTPVKSQTGGTCWTHGSMAALESNLLLTGQWEQYVTGGLESDAVPNLNEYHLDWWNGFNSYNNDDDSDPAEPNGLDPHYGGDYRITTAYMARGDGVVSKDDEPLEKDDEWYSPPPDRSAGNHHYRARDVAWYTVGANLEHIDAVKTALMDYGALGTCMYYGGGFYNGDTHYQPPADVRDPNHSIAIVGWDDNKATQAPDDGAWLCKNSWGSSWGTDGYFWISYYDKHSGQHPEMGAVSYQNVEMDRFTDTYYHDYHGWRDTLTGADTALNAFTTDSDDPLAAVGFYTAEDDVQFTVKIYDDFDPGSGTLGTELGSAAGTFADTGYHAVNLDWPMAMTPDNEFYIYLELSSGGQPFDRTSVVPVLLSALDMPDEAVVSDAAPGQSYYLDGSDWMDLFDLYLDGEGVGDVTGSANFCIQGYTVAGMLIGDLDLDGTVDYDDYTTVKSNLGQTQGMTWAGGDTDGDGDVDFTDYVTVKVNFGNTLPGGEAASQESVPEPSTLVMLAMGLVALLVRTRQK